ncbi:MAG: spondin domain-containing protein, partial [Chloroflexota bacterium]
MKPRYQRLLAAIVLFLGWSFSMQAGVAAAQAADVVTYKVTIMNLTKGQPFSPPVAATHRDGLHMFQVGQVATDQLAATAQDGNPVPLYKLVNSARFGNSAMVTQKVIKGNTVTDSASFVINASPGDTFSLATMLICTNDGFLGLDSVALPIQGSMTYDLKGYDAGREQNTELSKDIVDPCSALGPVKLAGDPNGNIDGPVATSPAQPIALHPGIKGGGDLSV